VPKRLYRRGMALAVATFAAVFAQPSASADTLMGALAQAYQNNPQLNAQRTAVRASDETVPQALAGYRPRVNLSASLSSQYLDNRNKSNGVGGAAVYTNERGVQAVQSYGATVNQPLLNGNQTASRTRQAEQLVSAARETLRLTEQTVLLAAATAYMNLIRDTAIFELQRLNIVVLQTQLRQAVARFEVREITRTDVAQAESRLSAGRSSALTAESNYTTARSTYRQTIGAEPGKLEPASPVDRLSPNTLSGGIAEARLAHPSVITAMFNVDAATLQVKIAESSLYPTLGIVGSATKTYGSTSSVTILETLNASISGQLSVPVYQGGSEYSLIRQAKETLTQRRIDLETARDQVQQTVVQSWAQLVAAKAQIESNQAQVAAAEVVLLGVSEEARVGQRTTLDVLNAQQELVNARVSLVTGQRDRVVASYTLLAATGRLSARNLSLAVPIYDPAVHYHQVRDSWIGVHTPDGK